MAGRNDQAGAAAGAAVLADFELNDDMVREYLKSHDDFLQRNPDLLDYLHISHASGSAISLVEKQVSVLRERNIDMRHRLKTLSGNARDNDRLYDHTRKLVLGLLEATDVAQLYDTFALAMRTDFAVDHACLILWGEEDDHPGCRAVPLEQAQQVIGPLLRSGKGVSGALRAEELQFLFPEGGEVGSAALAPLLGEQSLGLVAVGSRDANRYPSGVGTLFLSHIADVIVRLLPRLTPAGG
ncbi:MAG: hypothetical protein CME59_00335 [Halioglobus sp.]|nr:hypothetical protein [Halioglobus sp.]